MKQHVLINGWMDELPIIIFICLVPDIALWGIDVPHSAPRFLQNQKPSNPWFKLVGICLKSIYKAFLCIFLWYFVVNDISGRLNLYSIVLYFSFLTR